MLRRYAKPLLQYTLINPIKSPFRQYTPRRAVLYVPGSDIKKMKKALTLDVDCIVMDCEDGVAFNKKEQARMNIRQLLDEGKPEKKRKYDLAVRVNGPGTDFFKDDMSLLFGGKNLPDSIVLPKIYDTQELKAFSDLLKKHVKTDVKLQLIITIESALAFVNLQTICRESIKLSKSSKFTPSALLFGSDDFLANIGVRRTESSLEVLYARQKLIMYAKAFNLQAIDMVYIKYADLEGLEEQGLEGVTLGFTGKQVIHPGQIPIVQDLFLPSQGQIEWAAALLKAFHQHQQDGKGAFSYEGNMIDMPTVRQAQNIMDLINSIMKGENKNV